MQPGNSGTLELHRVIISNNAGVGVSVGDGTLSISQSTIDGNMSGGVAVSNGIVSISQSTISSNRGGGISVMAATMFDIENNFIIGNGQATDPGSSAIGGIVIVPNIGGAKLTFNTIAFNNNNISLYQSGVTCAGADVVAQGNIVYGNTRGTATTTAVQLGGACLFGNSLALGSVSGDLGFKSPTPPLDLHLTAMSPATIVNAGGACTGVDFDGDSRPVGSACDLGADEYRP